MCKCLHHQNRKVVPTHTNIRKRGQRRGMQNPIFQIPPETYQQLSDSERHLLDFIYKNLPRMSELSILKLSEEASVSTATIVRLMKKLGFDGYTSFKYSIKNNSHAMEDEPIKASVDTQIREAIRKNELEVIQTIQMLDTRQLEKAIQEIYKASKVYVFARGFSEFIGTELTVKLQLMGKNCEMHNDPNIIRVISRKLVKDDVVLFVSLNGETGELVEACKNFKIKEIPTITLTTRIDSSLARLSDIVIVGYKGEQSFFPEYEVRSRLPLHVLSRVLLDAYVIRLNNH
ncbi:hypothetical protein ERIC2_c16780 [Paenibacillus larvae subsp. larvae DSM 25430]|uniref:Uncharacterized protein n=4 Tax=Paenibacillus larvae TaxID=1464 RepID=V9W724_9BACL|nr:hypothetical protein ERIC2_c16780 [Paenibacillus larvae subsp. larvae DSM 25430]